MCSFLFFGLSYCPGHCYSLLVFGMFQLLFPLEYFNRGCTTALFVTELVFHFVRFNGRKNLRERNVNRPTSDKSWCIMYNVLKSYSHASCLMSTLWNGSSVKLEKKNEVSKKRRVNWYSVNSLNSFRSACFRSVRAKNPYTLPQCIVMLIFAFSFENFPCNLKLISKHYLSLFFFFYYNNLHCITISNSICKIISFRYFVVYLFTALLHILTGLKNSF